MSSSRISLRDVVAPTALVAALQQSAAVPFLGLVAPQSIFHHGHPAREIGGVGISLDPTLARRILVLAELTRAGAALLEETPHATIAAPTPFCLRQSVRTTLPDVIVRSIFEDAEEQGRMLPVEPADLARAIRGAAAPVDVGSPFVARVHVDLSTDAAIWTLSSIGATLVAAPLSLQAVRHVVAAAVQLGCYGDQSPEVEIQVLRPPAQGWPATQAHPTA